MSIETLDGIFLRQMPADLVQAVLTGDAHLYGSVIRNVANGQILGYLQEAAPIVGPLAASLVPGLGPVLGLAKTGLNLMEAAAPISNLVSTELTRRTTSSLAEATATLQTMGVFDLAMGAAGLGISVAGFAVMSAKIERVHKAVEGLSEQLQSISSKIDAVRQDLIDSEFAALSSLGKLMDEGWRLSDAGRAAKQWHEVAFEAQKLQDRFEGRAHHLLTGEQGYTVADPMLDAFALASGLRVAALSSCNEVEAATTAASDNSRTLARLTSSIGAADLAREAVELGDIPPGSPEWSLALAEATEQVRPVVGKIRKREAALATRGAPLEGLSRRGIKPSEWLRAAHEEVESPVLIARGD